MVGFIGREKVLSISSGALGAGEHEVLTMSDGRIITAYLTSPYGAITLMKLAGPNAEAVKIGEYLPGPVYGGMRDISMFENRDGGFTMILNLPSGISFDQDQIVMQRFSAAGVALGAPKALAEGFLDAIEAIPLKNGGFFLRYIDRQVDGGSQHDRLGVFYNAAGNEVGRQIFDPTATFTSTGIAEAAVLKNGNVAVAYGVQSGGTVTQVFTPTGEVVSSLRTVTEESRSLTAIAALPDGGYVVSYGGFSPVNAVFMQRFDATGRPVGGEVTFETGAGGATSVSISEPELAVTEDGLIALAWSGQAIGGTTDADIYLALFSPSGEPVFGPAIVNSVRQDSQVSPQFDVLPDGRLFLSFLDKAFKPFVYQDAIQGVYVETPDSFWEGTAAADSKSGTTGDDVLLGLNGDDRLNGLAGGDYIKGGLGADTIFGGDGGDELLGEIGNDVLSGDGGGDTLTGADGNDKIYGGKGNDLATGDGGSDSMSGGAGNDSLSGGDGSDRLYGQGGDDSLMGGADRDTISGGGGNDTVQGGDGNDVIKGDAGNDYLEGEAGRDLLRGGAGSDILRGGDDADRVYGEEGDDFIYSDGGNDKEYGGAGNDALYDSDGNDSMWGGTGTDRFVFQDRVFGQDRIKDFEFGVDTLDMGFTARALVFAGQGPIRVVEVAAGVRFVVDAGNWVLVEGARMSDFEVGDYLITDPFG